MDGGKIVFLDECFLNDEVGEARRWRRTANI